LWLFPPPLAEGDRQSFDCSRESLNHWFRRHAWRNQPDPIPAIILGQLTVDLRYLGQGIARSLMYFALSTILRLSKDIGCFCILTHPLDDGVRNFYRSFGFEDLLFDPKASMAVRMAAASTQSIHGSQGKVPRNLSGLG
jgi:GNAT superfamily N-acetyltransferase